MLEREERRKGDKEVPCLLGRGMGRDRKVLKNHLGLNRINYYNYSAKPGDEESVSNVQKSFGEYQGKCTCTIPSCWH